MIVTQMEHSSNYYPWMYRCGRNQVEFREAMVNEDGSLSMQSVLALMDKRTKLIAITAMSNVTGFRPSLETIIKEAHRNNTRVLIDASQEVAHHRISVKDLDCDFLCFSGHKVYGPMGIGVLYGKRAWLMQMSPYLYGGDMVGICDQGEVCYLEEPAKYEAGTQDIAAALGLQTALEYLSEHDFEQLTKNERQLSAYLRERMEKINGVHLIGTDVHSPIICFDSRLLGAYDIGVLLAGRGIAIRSGSHCAYPLMKQMKKESICRVSLGIYNTEAEMDRVAERLEQISGGGT